MKKFIILTLSLLTALLAYRLAFSYTIISFWPGFRKHKTSYVAYFPLVLFNPLKTNYLHEKLKKYALENNIKIEPQNYELISIVSRKDVSLIKDEYHVLFYCTTNNNDKLCYDSIVLVINERDSFKSHVY